MSRVLIIDDDGVVRDALVIFLTRDGHLVTTAADGANGLQVFKQNAPDLVVLDRDLPFMTGSAVLKKIREVSATVPVVMLTGHDAPEDAEKYLRFGATAFLSKKDGLLNALNEIDRVLGIRKRLSQQAVPQHAPAAIAATGDKKLALPGLLCVKHSAFHWGNAL
jgi:DNA-binding response OmpR family regulator